MNSLVVGMLALGALFVGYRVYGRLVSKWLGVDHEEPTPAQEVDDGVDYVAAKHWFVLFGHHFASIAGAAPIIGPVIACLHWGWGPAVVWLVIGGVLFGAVHDFSALTLSTRFKGRSVADLTESVIGKGAKVVFGGFVFLTMILIVAVFAAVAAQTLTQSPEVVIPTFGLIGVALLVGRLIYHTEFPLLGASALGVGLLLVFIALGNRYPIELPVENAQTWWTVILLGYGLIASVTPVNVLLQPRDHIAGGVLMLGMALGFGGLIVAHPPMRAPAFHTFSSPEYGWLWPMLIVTVACGAISGFHSLVASGTSSKQLPEMRHARRIGYGAMITETALAVLAVLAVSAGLYWKSGPAGGELVYQNLMEEGGWIETFGAGYGQLTKSFLGGYGALFGIMMLNTFITTTLDSATRITRYVTVELFGDTFDLRPLKNIYVATLLVGILAGALAQGNWQAIWPVFGSANQLIAALMLIVATVYLLERARQCWFTAVPAVIMLVTTMTALGFKTYRFFVVEDNALLGSISVLLILLGLFVSARSAAAIRRLMRESADAGGEDV